MNTAALGVILGVASLAGVAIVYSKVDDLSERLETRRETVSRTGGDADAPKSDWISPDRSSGRVQPLAKPNDAGTDSLPTKRDAAREVDETDNSPTALLERIRRLEEKNRTTASRPVMRWGGKRHVRNVDGLAKRLGLSRTQKDRITDIVDRTKQRIEDVMRIPDETGKSPFEQRKQQHDKFRAALSEHKDSPGRIISFASGMHSYRNKKIPGREETYGQEIDRIKGESKKEMRDTLDAKQQESFDDTNVDPMLGEGGSTMAVSYVAEAPVILEADDK